VAAPLFEDAGIYADFGVIRPVNSGFGLVSNERRAGERTVLVVSLNHDRTVVRNGRKSLLDLNSRRRTAAALLRRAKYGSRATNNRFYGLRRALLTTPFRLATSQESELMPDIVMLRRRTARQRSFSWMAPAPSARRTTCFAVMSPGQCWPACPLAFVQPRFASTPKNIFDFPY
jgi:hypothetical protein